MNVGDVVQFTENHKWCGCLGWIEEIKPMNDDFRYLVGVPNPQGRVAYIFSMASKNECEYIGRAVLMPKSEEDDI